MKTTFLFLLSTFLIVIQSALAQSNQSEFSVEQGIVDRIYDGIRKPDDQAYSTEMQMSADWIGIDEFTLSSRYYSVDYAKSLSAFPGANIGVLRTIYKHGAIDFSAGGSIGYGLTKGTFDAQSSGLVHVQDDISLQVIPLRLAGRLGYLIESPNLRPELVAGLGTQFFLQNGTLDGISQTFLLPCYFIAGQVRLFDSRRTDQIFGGIFLGSRFENQLSGKNKFSSLSYYLGTLFRM